jgi:hypothetical protein
MQHEWKGQCVWDRQRFSGFFRVGLIWQQAGLVCWWVEVARDSAAARDGAGLRHFIGMLG